MRNFGASLGTAASAIPLGSPITRYRARHGKHPNQNGRDWFHVTNAPGEVSERLARISIRTLGCIDMSPSRLWHLSIAESIKTCMLTTVASGRLQVRPMHAVPDRDQGCLWFITDQRGAKDEEIQAAPEVCLAFADTRSNTYLSVTGRAEMLSDSSKARNLWSAEAQAWWPKGAGRPRCPGAACHCRKRRILGYTRQFDRGCPQARSGPALRHPSGPWREQESAATMMFNGSSGFDATPPSSARLAAYLDVPPLAVRK